MVSMYGLTKEQRREIAQEGAHAYEQSSHNISDNIECPYTICAPERSWWLHGYWKTYYVECRDDAKRIAIWLLDNVSIVYDETQALSIGEIITHSGRYNRNVPIEDNRLCGVEFTIPAPATLD